MNHAEKRSGARMIFCAALLFLLGGAPLGASGTGQFAVRSALTSLSKGVYLLRARLNLDLSNATRRALESGVPLTILVEISVERRRRYLPWNELIATLAQRYRLAFDSLTQLYRVTNLNTGVQDGYPDIDTALQDIAEIDDLPMLDRQVLKSRARYEASLRVRLDIEALPAPLRVVAYVSPAWHLVSDWYTWPLFLNSFLGN